jgi:hypothetical protein
MVVLCSWRSAVSKPDFKDGQTYKRHISRHIRDHHMDKVDVERRRFLMSMRPNPTSEKHIAKPQPYLHFRSFLKKLPPHPPAKIRHAATAMTGMGCSVAPTIWAFLCSRHAIKKRKS